MPSIYFLPAAIQEVIDAHDWYETESKGLGAHFSEAVDIQLLRVSNDPLQFPIIFEDVRRVRLSRFPYSLFFRLIDDAIYFVACFHSSRDPQIWQNRSPHLS